MPRGEGRISRDVQFVGIYSLLSDSPSSLFRITEEGEVAYASSGKLLLLYVLQPRARRVDFRHDTHLMDGIAGKKVIKKEVEDTIIAVTMMILLGFMLLISIKDVINLF